MQAGQSQELLQRALELMDSVRLCRMPKVPNAKIRNNGAMASFIVTCIEFSCLQANVCEDSILLSTCIDAISRLGDNTRLSRLLKKYEASSPALKPHAYATIIKAYGRLGKLDKVRLIWDIKIALTCLVCKVLNLGFFDAVGD